MSTTHPAGDYFYSLNSQIPSQAWYNTSGTPYFPPRIYTNGPGYGAYQPNPQAIGNPQISIYPPTYMRGVYSIPLEEEDKTPVEAKDFKPKRVLDLD